MDEIRTVVVLGAGALGAVYASKFHAAGIRVAFLARGERGDRLAREGVEVNGSPLIIPVVQPKANLRLADPAPEASAPAQSTTPADLVIVALKDHALPGAIRDLRPVVGPETTILSVMNGLDSETALGDAYGAEKVLYTIAVGIDALREGRSITYTRTGKLIFGEADNTEISPRVARVQAVLDRAGLAHETPVDMIRMLWWKFMVNVGVNQASAVMRAPYGLFQTDADAQALMETLMREVIALAQHLGVALVERDIAEWYAFLNTLSPQGKTSMLQDIEAGRRTEVDIFAGKVVALGEANDLPTPVNRTVLRIIHVLERHPAL